MNAVQDFPLYLIPLLPLIGAAINLIVGKRLSREANHLIACTAVGAAAVIALHAVLGQLYPMTRIPGVSSAKLVWQGWEWLHAGGMSAGSAPAMTPFSVHAGLLLDPLSGVMILVITIIGFLIHLYSVGYMAHEKRYATYFGYLNLFTGAMLILVLGDSLPVMFVGWEGVGLCSYLLIGFWFTEEKNASAGKKAFITNRIGDFGFLIGIFIIYHFTQALTWSELSQVPATLAAQPMWHKTAAFWACLFLFIGAAGKSAQIPLYVWLPDAMAGPTPVSALIHAATMVTAGVYMIARLSFLYAVAPQVLAIVAGVGAATALFAAIIGFAQNDLKKVLAYSTVSQLGLMFVGVGTGNFTGGVFHLVTHAFFKAGLFLAAGSVMHAMSGSGDITKMGGLRKKLPYTHWTFLIYCLAIAGVPPLAGFFSKDWVLADSFATTMVGWPRQWGHIIWAASSLASLFTAIYMFRLYFLVFTGPSRADEETQHHIHESPSEMTIPLIILAIGTVLVGFLGIPTVFHAKNVFAQWLKPSVEAGTLFLEGMHAPLSHSTEFALMAVATVLALAGIGLAAALWLGGYRPAVQRLSSALGPVRRVVANKFYIDEIYSTILVRPFKFLCSFVYTVFDRFLIDTVLVSGAAIIVEFAGRALRLLQSGNVQRYLVAIVAGLALMIYLGSRPSGGFTVARPAGERSVELHANADSYGPVADKHVSYRWKCDKDKDWETGGPTKVCPYETDGKHRVSLEVTDNLWHSTRRSSQTVTVAKGGE